MDEKYKKYLSSPEWSKKREQRMKMDRYLCQECGSAFGLVVHHENYKNIYNEKMDDLITLCKRCHTSFHTGKSGNFDPDTFWWQDYNEQRYNQFEMGRLLKFVGGQLSVLGYMLEKKDEDNRLSTSVRDIMSYTNLSRYSVNSALESFEKRWLIVFFKIGALYDIFVNPSLGYYGSDDRFKLLESEFLEDRNKKYPIKNDFEQKESEEESNE